jgi:predicted RNA-binding Zn-ribbon protein involved in translation (DUF1610 family)
MVTIRKLSCCELSGVSKNAYSINNQAMKKYGHRSYLSITKTCVSCGKEEIVRVQVVRMQLHKYSEASILCNSCSKSGNNNSRWRGGIHYNGFGYILEYCPTNPHATKAGCVLQHRLVMESVLGRYLLDTEYVHHINGIRDDNRPENLELWSDVHPSGVRIIDNLSSSVCPVVNVGDIINGFRVTGRWADSSGYVTISIKGYPGSRQTGYIFEHRLVMEKIIGRHLNKSEEVHHKDRNKQNNNPNNLELWSHPHPKSGVRVCDTVHDK